MSLFLERKFPPMSIKITIKTTLWFKKIFMGRFKTFEQQLLVNTFHI